MTTARSRRRVVACIYPSRPVDRVPAYPSIRTITRGPRGRGGRAPHALLPNAAFLGNSKESGSEGYAGLDARAGQRGARRSPLRCLPPVETEARRARIVQPRVGGGRRRRELDD